MSECPHIRSSDEGTQWCELAESSVEERDAEIARLRAENARWRKEFDEAIGKLALYESAQEIITTPSGRVWVAAEKHEMVVNRLREALEKMNLGAWRLGADQIRNIAREALAEHAPVEGEKTV